MYAIFGSQFRHRALSLHGLQRNTRLERRIVVPLMFVCQEFRAERWPGGGFDAGVFVMRARMAGGRAFQTTVDHTLMRGLGTA